MKRHNFSLDMGRGEIKSAKGVENFIKLPRDLDRTCKVWCKETVVIKKDARKYISGSSLQGSNTMRKELRSPKMAWQKPSLYL